jgi:hypothetical protein
MDESGEEENRILRCREKIVRPAALEPVRPADDNQAVAQNDANSLIFMGCANTCGQ